MCFLQYWYENSFASNLHIVTISLTQIAKNNQYNSLGFLRVRSHSQRGENDSVNTVKFQLEFQSWIRFHFRPVWMNL